MVSETFDMTGYQSPAWTLADTAELATTISAPLALISVIVAAAAFLFTRRQHTAALRNFNETLRSAYYAELDRMYFDLIAMRIGKPHFSGNPADIAGREQRQEYEQYGFLVWNFLETVYDRCIAPSEEGRGHSDLACTWTPAFRHEMRTHREWFAERHHGQFKAQFCRYILSVDEEDRPTTISAVSLAAPKASAIAPPRPVRGSDVSPKPA